MTRIFALAVAAAAALAALLVGAGSPATSGTVPGPAPTHASRTGVRIPLEAGWPTSGAVKW